MVTLFEKAEIKQPDNWWSLDWDATATYGSIDGTATNVTYEDSPRWFQKQVWVFNWSSSWITTWDIDLWLSWSNFTISLFFKKTSIWTLIQKWTNWVNNNIPFHLWIVTSTFDRTRIIIGTWSNSFQSFWSNTIDSWWHHVVFIKNWTSYKVILDNDYDNPDIDTTSLLNPYDIADTLNIWRWFNYFWWNIIWVKIYDWTVLTKSEIQALYKEWLRELWQQWYAGSLLSNVVTYYDFIEASTTSIFDITNWTNWTVTWTPSLTTNRFSDSNNALILWGWTKWISQSKTWLPTWTSDYTIKFSYKWTASWWASWSWYWITVSWNSANGNDYILALLSAASWSSYIKASIWDGSWTETTADVNTSIADWERHRIVIVRDNTSRITIYEDWIQIHQSTLTNRNNWTNNLIRLCWNLTTWWAKPTADITFDEYVVLDKALSSIDVKADYNLSLSKYPEIWSSTLTPSLRYGQQLRIKWDNNGAWTFYDLSGNGNDWTGVNSPTTGRLWKNKYVKFNWTNQYINWSANSVTWNFTLMAWLKRDWTQSANAWIIDYWSFAWAGTWFGLWCYDSTWWFSDWQLTWRINNTYNNYASINYVIPDLTWVHIAIVYNWTDVKLYADTKLISTIAHTTNPNAFSTYILSKRQDAAVYSDFDIDDNIYYNRDISLEEIQQEYYRTYHNN